MNADKGKANLSIGAHGCMAQLNSHLVYRRSSAFIGGPLLSLREPHD